MYISDVETNPALEVYYDKKMNDHTVSFGIGGDSVKKESVRMVIQLFCTNDFVPEEDQIHQFRYFTKVYDVLGAEIPNINYAPSSVQTDRKLILAHIVTSIENIVGQAQPMRIERYTAEGDLPFKALIKYMIVSEAICLQGYRTKIIEIRDTQGYWLHERI